MDVKSNAESSSAAPQSSYKTPREASSLDQPAVQALLKRLYRQEAEQDARVQVQREQLRVAVPDDESLQALNTQRYLAVAPEVGRLIYLLVRSHRPHLAVEFGASMGISAIHIAAALRDNGQGRLITTESNLEKTPHALRHLEEAGLADLVELRVGDAFETLRNVDRIDLLLLDGWKPLYLPLLRQLEPKLAPGCLILADDTILAAAAMADYLAYVRDPRNRYVSCPIPIDDGLELSIR
jgi:predicted O-methyltransferase YrrM